jgi:hypothetical protein
MSAACKGTTAAVQEDFLMAVARMSVSEMRSARSRISLRSSGLRLLIHFRGECPYICRRLLCDVEAVVPLLTFLLFEKAAGNKCGVIGWTELGRLLVELFKAARKRKNAGVSASQACDSRDRFKD